MERLWAGTDLARVIMAITLASGSGRFVSLPVSARSQAMIFELRVKLAA